MFRTFLQKNNCFFKVYVGGGNKQWKERIGQTLSHLYAFASSISALVFIYLCIRLIPPSIYLSIWLFVCFCIYIMPGLPIVTFSSLSTSLYEPFNSFISLTVSCLCLSFISIYLQISNSLSAAFHSDSLSLSLSSCLWLFPVIFLLCLQIYV